MNRNALIAGIAATVIAAGVGISISYAADNAVAPTTLERLDGQLSEIAHQSRLADKVVCDAGAAGIPAATIAEMLAGHLGFDEATVVRPAVDRTLLYCPKSSQA